jgi:UDP-glucose 4-epimerase
MCMYGQTKLLGELACEFHARNHGLSVVVLRLCGYHRQAAARPQGGIDWPAADLGALAQDAVLPGQRLFDPADLGAAFAAALRVEEVQFRRYLIGLRFPFTAANAEELRTDTLGALERHYPGAQQMAQALRWQPQPIDRYYDVSRAERELGFRARTDLSDVIAEFRRRQAL